MTIEQRPSLSIALPKSYLFTSESVTEGHPDKMCDQISDAILDAIISKEIELEREGYIAPSGQPADVSRMRCACETLATTGLVAVAGEIRTQAYVDVPAIVREVVCGIGYDRAKYGFDGTTCGVVNAIHEQSPDIAQGVDESWEAAHGGAADDPYELIGAGDQGMMFGYACNETSTLMPMPIYLAQRMSERLAAVRKDGTLDYLRPDGKTQVSVRYEDGAPKWVEKVVVSTQHAEEAPYERLRADVVEQVVRPVLAGEGVALSPDAEIHVNPTGRFVIGGPMGDCGLTGRKVIVDTYGGMGRHGGGAFSGKDCTKVDRSAAYAARWVAKNVVAAGLAARCRWPTPSAWRAPCRSWWRRSAPRRRRWGPSSARWPRCSTCAPAPSSTRWICAAPSTARRPPTATSAASCPSSPGSAPTAPRICERPAG